WSNGFLPSQHQGVMFESKGPPIRDLLPARPIDPAVESASRELQAALNRLDLADREADDDLVARMKAYEMAAKMQLAVPKVTDLSQETAATTEMYGLNGDDTRDFGRNCLLARRL